ncbi:glycosyltransferase [Synechococcus sp. CS-1325]|uniref:glycosyltransferase n=1 Tax=unclassified Synechococcus TaxID=2626047 RepID=UPI000DB7EC38|nr:MULTISPECIES: glycosyltransferase [unclassified Synechococcus]MCT0198467.1 glycosyltransferase [Synechococcus sp. CS-1325]MCT0213587.1 glycosyltransferase [Synechococcus sp. CS-1326]MCT0232178.1 glycosyltransferase [Synechococcus sp. CS-1327]PZV01743.1 MAG: glycosyltransferase family 4 protein [Cyanobium sp.]
MADDLWIVVPHLGAGGAQKVAMLAAAHFAALGYRITVVSLLPDKTQVHSVPAGVRLLDLGEAVKAAQRGDWWDRSLLARSRRFLRLWLPRLASWFLLITLWPWLRQLRPPRGAALIRWLLRGVGGPQASLLRQLLVAEQPPRLLALLTKTNMLAAQASWDLPLHLAVSERNDPRLQTLGFPWQRLRLLLYRRADALTANTRGVLRTLADDLAMPQARLLPNPLPPGIGLAAESPANANANTNGNGQRSADCLAVARLVHQKGLDVLLEAVALMAARPIGWRLVIVGDGPQRPALESQARQLGIEAWIRFEGFQADVMPYCRRARIFVLPSRFEGMPNALLEAMASGLTAIVTDASPGPLELVEHGHTGLVVPVENPRALAAAMEALLADPGHCERLGRAGRERLAAQDWQMIEPLWRSALNLPAVSPERDG